MDDSLVIVAGEAARIEIIESAAQGPPGPPGPQGPPGAYGGGTGGDAHHVHHQMQAAATWEVTHGLGKHPAVTVTDSAGTEVVGAVEHISTTHVRLTFSAAFSGFAFFN